MIDDWEKEIAIAVKVQEELVSVDTKHLLQYHLPNPAATEQELVAAEKDLGFPLDPQYRNFLSRANGWQSFYQDVELFGTEELQGGPLMQEALALLEETGVESLEEEKITISDLLPIAYSRTQNDALLILKPGSVTPGMVLWFAVYEIARFPSFDEFFLAMVDYNRNNLQELQEEGLTEPEEAVDGAFWLSARQASTLGTSTIADWKSEIAAAVEVQEENKRRDTDKIWDYHPPNMGATEQDLVATEKHLGFGLDPQYRNFLSHANGWRCFTEDVDLFGTEELRGGPLMKETVALLKELGVEYLEDEQITLSDLLPIGHSRTQRDEFLLLKPGSVAPGMVIWLYLPEIGRFPSFDAFFRAKVEDNRLRP